MSFEYPLSLHQTVEYKCLPSDNLVLNLLFPTYVKSQPSGIISAKIRPMFVIWKFVLQQFPELL